MDIKKKSWIEEKRKNWPERSLEKTLVRDYPGCKSAFEAVKKVLSEKQSQQTESIDPPKRKTIPTNSDYEIMKQAVLDVEDLLKEVNVDLIPLETRQIIARMPITTAAEALDWKNAWVKALGAGDGGERKEEA